MQPQIELIVSKLEGLSPERLTQEENFVDFLRARDQERNLVQDYAQASEADFAKAWDNSQDANYDQS